MSADEREMEVAAVVVKTALDAHLERVVGTWDERRGWWLLWGLETDETRCLHSKFVGMG